MCRGVDFDDLEFGFKEEDKPTRKAENEALFKVLAEKCEDSQFGTIAEAISYLDVPRLKATRPYKTYDGPLTLGDPELHPDAMSISVERYFKTHKAAIPPASRVVLKNTPSSQDTVGDAMEGVEVTSDYSAVKNARTYQINDPDAVGGKKMSTSSLSPRDTSMGALLSTSASRNGISPRSRRRSVSRSSGSCIRKRYACNITLTKCFFWPNTSQYEPFLNMGETGMTVAQKLNDAAALKLSSFIHSLAELESYAVARIVTKEGKDPQLLLLAPHIEDEFECLYDVPLPFAEDVRHYKFPPLDEVVTITGKKLAQHDRLLPSNELQEVMNDYVNAMDISSFDRDDEG